MIPSWLHNYSFADISWLIGISRLSHCCSNDYWESNVRMKNNKDRKNREKKGHNFDILISNHEIGFLNFLKFIAFTILVTFCKVKLMIQCREGVIRKCSVKKVFLEILQKYTRKYLCRSDFFNKVASLHPVSLLKKILRHRCF